MLFKSALFLLLLGCTLDAAPTPSSPPTNSATSPTAENTADALWIHLNNQVKALSAAVRNQDPAAKDLVPQIFATADALTSEFPSSPHFWDAKMVRARTGAKALENQLATAPTPPQLDREFGAIDQNKDAPLALRAEASSGIIDQAIDQAGKSADETSAPWDAIDASIARFQRQFGSVVVEGSPSPAAELREDEVDTLETSANAARYHALLVKLAADPDPKIAAMATRKIAAGKHLAALRAKPLELKFTAVDGTQVDLAGMRGKVVLIDFWATWCPDCRIETPDVVATYNKFHDRGFEILGISLDKDQARLLAFTKRNGMPWPQYFDGQVWQNSISKSFDIDFIPADWLVDKNGMLVTTDGSPNLAGQVKKLLKAP